MTRPRLPAGGFSLTEILVAVAVTAALALPLIEMRSSSQRALRTLPNRLFALYFAFDLMEERLALPLARIRPIRETRVSDYVWVRKNLQRLLAETDGDRRERVEISERFLERFRAAVDVTPAAGGAKRVRVLVRWDEQGVEKTHVLEATAGP